MAEPNADGSMTLFIRTTPRQPVNIPEDGIVARDLLKRMLPPGGSIWFDHRGRKVRGKVQGHCVHTWAYSQSHDGKRGALFNVLRTLWREWSHDEGYEAHEICFVDGLFDQVALGPIFEETQQAENETVEDDSKPM